MTAVSVKMERTVEKDSVERIITQLSQREKADKVITTAKGTKVFISYPTDVSDVVRQEKINHIYDILTQHKLE